MNKHFLASKTIIFNGVVVLLALLGDHSAWLQGFLSNDDYMLATALISAANIYLRAKTSTGIYLKK